MRPERKTADDFVRVERVSNVSWVPVIVVVAMVAVISVATWKPWGTTSIATRAPIPPAVAAAARATSAATAQAATPRATDDPAIVAAINRSFCGEPPEWRLLTTETGPLGDTRTLYGTTPAAATGPTDPTIPTANVAASRLFSIGVCRPLTGGREPAADGSQIHVSMWSIDRAGKPIAVPTPVVLDKVLYSIGEAYYGPQLPDMNPQLVAHVTPTWTPGHYVLDIVKARADGSDVWFGLNFTSTSAAPGGGGIRPGS